VRINLGAGSATLHVADLEIEDYHDVANAVMGGASVEASVSFDIGWSGADERVNIRNRVTGFAGEYARNTASLVWSARESEFSFQADSLASDFVQIGKERNGVFFAQGS
jgi:hypothetical protein